MSCNSKSRSVTPIFCCIFVISIAICTCCKRKIKNLNKKCLLERVSLSHTNVKTTKVDCYKTSGSDILKYFMVLDSFEKPMQKHMGFRLYRNKSCQKPTIELAGRLGKNLTLAHWTLDISEVMLASKSLLIQIRITGVCIPFIFYNITQNNVPRNNSGSISSVRCWQ